MCRLLLGDVGWHGIFGSVLNACVRGTWLNWPQTPTFQAEFPRRNQSSTIVAVRAAGVPELMAGDKADLRTTCWHYWGKIFPPILGKKYFFPNMLVGEKYFFPNMLAPTHAWSRGTRAQALPLRFRLVERKWIDGWIGRALLIRFAQVGGLVVALISSTAFHETIPDWSVQ